MIHIVLDTNALIIILSERSQYHWILREIMRGRIHLSLTTDILLEYEEVLTRKYSTSVAQTVLAALPELENVHFVYAYFRWNAISKDPDDNKFVDCAVAAGVNALLTEDSHFNILSATGFPPLHIASLQEFSEKYASLFA